MHLRLLRLSPLIILLLASSLALAQSNSYTIPRWTISSGGGKITGDGFTLSGTFSQSFAGQIQGNGFTLTSGLWRSAKAEDRILAIYALAMDNEPTNNLNLDNHYQPTIDEIIKVTDNDPAKIAVILVDHSGQDDTQILVVRNGHRSIYPRTLLPAELQETEYDMTDGATLGKFIRWARDNFSAKRTIFTYVGHGLPLAPDTDIVNIFEPDAVAAAADEPRFPFPIVPTRKFIHPGFTDYHPQKAVISPYDLAEAFKIGTNQGTDPLDVIDITHCFAASIEEFYELSNPTSNPYKYFAKFLIGSPNYTYFAPELIGAALQDIQPDQEADSVAKAMLGAYDRILQQADANATNPNQPNPYRHPNPHPRVIVAVESSKIPAIKQTIDELADLILRNFDRKRIEDAYTASTQYDTNFCEPLDWLLKEPDALSDLADFATQLATEFDTVPEVHAKALLLADQVNMAVVDKIMVDGWPWFADPVSEWNFRGAGLSIYTDFQGTPKSDGFTYISWHAHWYTNTVYADNPNPYAFVRPSATGSATWADVLQRFWKDVPVKTEACLPIFPPILYDGELSVTDIIFPAQRTTEFALSLNLPTEVSAAISTTGEIRGALVNFTITSPTGQVVFSDTVNAGYMIKGTYMVPASRLYTPTGSIGPGYNLIATVDSDNRILEKNETIQNNSKSRRYILGEFFERPTLTASVGEQWIAEPTATLTVTKGVGNPIGKIEVQLYQYIDSPQNVQVPDLRFTNRYTATMTDENPVPLTFKIPLSTTISQPGLVEMHVWGINGANLTLPAIVRFNYIPPNIPLAADQAYHFLFDADAGDVVEFDLTDVPPGKDANLFIWGRFNYSAKDPDFKATNSGNDNLLIDPIPDRGPYVVSLLGVTNDTSYKLQVKHRKRSTNAIAANALNFVENVDDSLTPDFRPVFVPAVPQPPRVPTNIYLPLVMNNYAAPLPDLVITNLVVTSDNMELTIRNQGEMTVTNDFWVDVYIDPSPPPTSTNQIWEGLSFQGLVWAVGAPVVPLPPNGTVTLTLNDSFYTPTLSVFTPPLITGTIVYAQVDSANDGVNYGAVLEADERDGALYNNIISTTVTSGIVIPTLKASENDISMNNSIQSANLPPRPMIQRSLSVEPTVADTESPILLPESQTVVTSTLWLPLIQE